MAAIDSPALPRLSIGDITVTALDDGTLQAPLSLLTGISVEEAAARQGAAGITPPDTVHITAYLIQTPGRTVLMDAGAGGYPQGEARWGGRLLQSLASINVAPADIDTLLLTHAHPDHIGGLLTPQGQAQFPRAQLSLHAAELAHWQDAASAANATSATNATNTPPRRLANIALAQRVFAAYGARLHTFGDATPPPGLHALPALPGLPEITPHPLPGHTPGHTGYRIAAARQPGHPQLFIWGDLVHFPHLQLPDPRIAIAFDHAPDTARRTRQQTLAWLTTQTNTRVGGMHLGPQGFAKLVREGDGDGEGEAYRAVGNGAR